MSVAARPSAARAYTLLASAVSLARPHVLPLVAISAIALIPIYALDYFDGVRAGAYDSLLAAGAHGRHLIGVPNLATIAKYLISLVLAPLQALAAVAALAQIRAHGNASIRSAYAAAAPLFARAVGAGFRYSTPLGGGFFAALAGIALASLGGWFVPLGAIVFACGFAAFSIAGFAFSLALVQLVVEGQNPGHWFGLVRRALANPASRGATFLVIALFPISLACAMALDVAAAWVAAYAVHSRVAYETLRLLAMASVSAFGNVYTFVYDEELRAHGDLAPVVPE